MLLIHIPILLIMDRRLYKALPTHQSVYLALFFLFLFSCSYSCPCSFYANTNLPHNHPYSPPLHSLSGKMLIWAMRNIERRLQQIEILSDGTPANESDLLDLVKDWCTGITRYDTVYPSLYRLV